MENLTSNTVSNGTECIAVENFVYLALNCYYVTITHLIISLLTMTVGLLIVILNTIVLVAVIRRPSLENVTDILIASLAMSDTVIGSFLIYQCCYNLGNWQIFEECIVRYAILLGANLTTVFNLCFLTIDRYVKITKPYFYQRVFQKPMVLTVTILLGVLAFTIGFSPFYKIDTIRPEPSAEQCSFFLVMTKEYEMIFTILFLIPLITNIVLYTHIFKITQRHARAIADQQQANASNPGGQSKRSTKFTKTVALLMGFYFVCWMPLGVFLFLDYLDTISYLETDGKATVVVYLSVLAYINSMVNPIIYAVKIPYVKQRFVQTCWVLPCCRRLKGKRILVEENTQSIQYIS